jgi:hypothetical protein
MIDYEKYKVDGEFPVWVELFKKSEHFLAAALEYDYTHTLQDVADKVNNCTMQLWPLGNAALVTEIQNHPRCSVLHVYLAGGDLNTILNFEPQLKAFGRDMGCTRMSLAGRPGWEKALKHWKKSCIYLSTEIENV